jgi:trigger factor
MAKLTIEASAEEFDQAIQKAYQKNKNRISVHGFRRGKAPLAIIEKMYGPEIFYEDAANEIIPEAYEKAAKESGLEIVSRPAIDVVQIEKGKPFIFTAHVAVKPDVTLGAYKGIEVEKKEITVTDEEVMNRIEREREQNARIIEVEDRPVQMNDIVVIDYEGFVDGKAFEGGKAEDYSLTIGSKTFIDNFEEQLIGKSLGEEVEVNVTFPEDYHAKDLAGKPAMFKVKIKEIKYKELPELNDDFAQDVSEFNTLDEYKESIKAKIKENKEKELKTARENEILDKIIENATMDIPDAMVETQAEQMVEDFAQRIRYQGMSIDQYFKFTGMNYQKLLDNMKPQALKTIQTRLVLEAIVKAENIEVTDEELDKELTEMASIYKTEVDKLKEMLGDKGLENMKLDIAVQKAIDLVVAEAKEV